MVIYGWTGVTWAGLALMDRAGVGGVVISGQEGV